VLTVSSFEVELRQQDSYFDNISVPAFFTFVDFPQSYHLQTNTDLFVHASTGTMQSGWGVEFILEDKTIGDQQIIYDFSMPFEYHFNDLIKHEYLIEASIVDESNSPIPGNFTYDMNDPIGIGDYYVAIGDSITWGAGDDISIDNNSLDNRNISRGYEPILNNLLTAGKAYPHTVINEGISGEESIEGLARIQDVIDAYPDAQYFLILFGTNDSAGTLLLPDGVPSGLGSSSPAPGTFKYNMQEIITAIVNEGKTPILGKVPITLGPCSTCTPFLNPDTASRNMLIQQYNEVIDELVSANGTAVIGPDFYELFNEDFSGEKRYDFEYSDNLHPNGIGYQSMADSWKNVLLTLP